jgi:hypothetical protein
MGETILCAVKGNDIHLACSAYSLVNATRQAMFPLLKNQMIHFIARDSWKALTDNQESGCLNACSIICSQ